MVSLVIGSYLKEKVFYTDNCPAKKTAEADGNRTFFYHSHMFTGKLFPGVSPESLLEEPSLRTWWLLTKKSGVCLATGQHLPRSGERAVSQAEGTL